MTISQLHQWVELASTWATDNLNIQFVGGLCLGLLLVGVSYAQHAWDVRRSRKRNKIIRKERGKWMAEKSRQSLMNMAIADGVVDVIENLRYQGKITNKEADAKYRRLANALNIPNLLPEGKKTIPQIIVQGRLLSRLRAKYVEKTLPEDVNVIPFPDAKKIKKPSKALPRKASS